MSVCIVIGAGPGVGEAIARRFGKGGFRLGLIARNAEKLSQQAERLRGIGLSAHWQTADAGDVHALEAAIHSLRTELGGCDVLIYNAAILRSDGPLSVTTETLAKEFAANVLGAHTAAQLVIPEMLRKGQGAVLLTGGGLALEPFPEWTSLALGKAALRSLAFSLYKECAPQGVHIAVLAICGIVAPDGPFDPDVIAQEYWRVATSPNGIEDREVIFQPKGTDPLYNDPNRIHSETTILPNHAKISDQLTQKASTNMEAFLILFA